jgi:hypothetical protein
LEKLVDENGKKARMEMDRIPSRKERREKDVPSNYKSQSGEV